MNRLILSYRKMMKTKKKSFNQSELNKLVDKIFSYKPVKKEKMNIMLLSQVDNFHIFKEMY